MATTDFGQFLVHLTTRIQSLGPDLPPGEMIWLVIGLFGQCLFMMRFIVQWLHSERHGESRVPDVFWYLSLGGGAIVLVYGIHKVEPVIILGQLPGLFVYMRNIMLIRKSRRVAPATKSSSRVTR